MLNVTDLVIEFEQKLHRKLTSEEIEILNNMVKGQRTKNNQALA
ncbi:hypothetical protein [Halalkalibacter wakoensis]|nr:hypothetical protein [Halalkalibacter wakoensis]